MRVQILYDKRAVLLDSPAVQGADRYLVITDIHIGFEESFRASGVRIQNNIERVELELESLVKQNSVTDLIINGDLKSGVDRIRESEWEDVPKFLTRLLKICRVHVVPGNHDGGLINLMPTNAVLEDINGLSLDDTLILHGHTRPLEKFNMCRRLILGHVHPTFKRRGSPISGSPVWIFLKIKKKKIFREMLGSENDHLLDVIVVPSFNLELSLAGLKQEYESDRSISSLIKDLRSADEAAIVTLKGEVIGDISNLPNIL